MQGHTQKNGEKTRAHTRVSALTIQNKDPNFEYSFRRKRDIEDGQGQDRFGYVPIGESNYNNETFGSYPGNWAKKNSKQLTYMDTIACKRPKEVSKYFKAEEDEKYNAQVRHVMGASKRTRAALRELDPDAIVQDKSSFSGPSMKQRKGPTEEEK